MSKRNSGLQGAENEMSLKLLAVQIRQDFENYGQEFRFNSKCIGEPLKRFKQINPMV